MVNNDLDMIGISLTVEYVPIHLLRFQHEEMPVSLEWQGHENNQSQSILNEASDSKMIPSFVEVI